MKSSLQIDQQCFMELQSLNSTVMHEMHSTTYLVDAKGINIPLYSFAKTVIIMM